MTATDNSSAKKKIIPKVDRDEVFLELTKSICPVCKKVLDAEINARDNKIFLRKRCDEHGPFEALLYGDAQMYMDSQRYNKPGTIPAEFQTEVVDGCPLDCGLCPDHKQHACVGLIEVNTDCNLDCPICFADSGHQPDGFSLTHDQVAVGIKTFVDSEGGEAEMIMFSGGEPSIHPHIIDFIDMALEANIKHVILNTNGIKLAKNLPFCKQLAARDVGIYLQFDGFEEKTHMEIRGRDLRKLKEEALDNCAEVGLKVMLTAAIEKGLNDHEMGAIVKHGVEHAAVVGAMFQPVTHAGRMLEFDPTDRMTNTDVIHGMVDQIPEWFTSEDFFPVPCCAPTCRSISYCLTDKDAETGESNLLPLSRLFNPSDHLDYLSNQVYPDSELRSSLEKLFSASASPSHATTVAEIECVSCGIDMSEIKAKEENETGESKLTDKLFMLVIQDFQDPYTLNVKTLMKCCVEQITPDGRLIPFCAYNSVGYREEVREQLSGAQLHDYVPNSAELADQLVSTEYGSLAHKDDPAAQGTVNVHINKRHKPKDGTNRGKTLRPSKES